MIFLLFIVFTTFPFTLMVEGWVEEEKVGWGNTYLENHLQLNLIVTIHLIEEETET